MARTRYMLDKQNYMRARTHALPGAQTHVRTDIYNTFFFSTATMIRERASILRYMYIICYFLCIFSFLK
jgi:hypothetical protein